jgi:hypothetical protein
VPVPLVIRNRSGEPVPAVVHDPPAENVTGSPDVLLAATENAVSNVAVAGACTVTMIV